MTDAEFLVAYRDAWIQGQTPEGRKVFAMQPNPNETAPDFMARKLAAAQVVSPVDAAIMLNNWEPLIITALRNQAGLTSVPDWLGRGGSLPVPKMVLRIDGSPDASQADVSLVALAVAYPVHPDYLPTACPFRTDWPADRTKGLWIPLDTDKTPAGGLWQAANGKQYQKRAYYGQAGATGQPVLFWKDLSISD